MKQIASFLVALDFLLLVAWVAGAVHLLTQLRIDKCFEAQWIDHFLILIHFALAYYLTSLIGEISREERRAQREATRRNVQLLRLPYVFYQPLAWFFVTVSSVVGDALLLVCGILLYEIRGDDACREVRLVHIAFDALATIISLLSMLWFVVFSLYNIRYPSCNTTK